MTPPRVDAQAAEKVREAEEMAETVLAGDHHARCNSRRGKLCDCYAATRPEYVLARGVQALAAELVSLKDALDGFVTDHETAMLLETGQRQPCGCRHCAAAREALGSLDA